MAGLFKMQEIAARAEEEDRLSDASAKENASKLVDYESQGSTDLADLDDLSRLLDLTEADMLEALEKRSMIFSNS